MNKYINIGLNIGLSIVIIAAILGGRHYYSVKLDTEISIENMQRKIEGIRKEISAIKAKMNTLGIRQLNSEKSRLEKQQEQLKAELDRI